jgi:hypothetical protein
MEAIGVIGFALAGTRNFYQTVVGIKGAPKSIRQLCLTLEKLLEFLEQLQTSKIFADPHIDLRALITTIHECDSDIRTYQRILNPYLLHSQDSKIKSSWKRLRSFLSEADLAKVTRVVSGHYDRLGAQLSLLQL